MPFIMSAHLIYTLMSLLALMSLTSANFDIYHTQVYHREAKDGAYFVDSWMIFNDDPVCASSGKDKVYYMTKKDLSHGRLGVRCEGTCRFGDAPWPKVSTLEMHFANYNPNYHLTIYNKEDRGHQEGDTWMWHMYEADTGQWRNNGVCFAYGDHEFQCNWGYDDQMRRVLGWRKFRCITDLDSDVINAQALRENGGPQKFD